MKGQGIDVGVLHSLNYFFYDTCFIKPLQMESQVDPSTLVYFGQSLRALEITCAPFGRDQICIQIDTIFHHLPTYSKSTPHSPGLKRGIILYLVRNSVTHGIRYMQCSSNLLPWVDRHHDRAMVKPSSH